MRNSKQIPLGHPDTLRHLMVSQGARAAAVADDESLLAVARSPDHKLAITLLSAWSSAGHALGEDQDAELAANRARIWRYAQTWSVISGAAPDAYLVKGSTIGTRYPPGLLRSAGDLDVICPAGQIWPAALALTERGWEFHALTIFPKGATARAPRGEQAGDRAWWHLLIELRQPSDSDFIDEPYAVELRTVEIATSLRTAAQQASARPAAPAAPVAGNILALAAERWERPFRSRDVYDLAVLTESLDQAELASLRAGLTATGLWPQLAELSRLLRRSGLRPAPELPGSRRLAWQARAARLAAAAAAWSNPLRAAGFWSLNTVDEDRGALADRLARVVYERIGTWRLLRLGLPLFAVPLAAEIHDLEGYSAAGNTYPSRSWNMRVAVAQREYLVRAGGHVLAVTPIGAFLMVAGACQESWLTEATEGLDSAVSAAGLPDRHRDEHLVGGHRAVLEAGRGVGGGEIRTPGKQDDLA